jgi:hypothetical protein
MLVRVAGTPAAEPAGAGHRSFHRTGHGPGLLFHTSGRTWYSTPRKTTVVGQAQVKKAWPDLPVQAIIPYRVTHISITSGSFQAIPVSNPCIFIAVHPNRV